MGYQGSWDIYPLSPVKTTSETWDSIKSDMWIECKHGQFSEEDREMKYMLLLTVGIVLCGSSVAQGAEPESSMEAIAPCPNRPNCVSSIAEDAGQKVEAFLLRGDGARDLACLRKLILRMPRSAIVEERDGYLHATFKSKVFKFIDDLELLVAREQGVIHVRSAARTGYYDFNVNRDRVEALRVSFKEECDG